MESDETEQMITYRHKNSSSNPIRFRQYKKDPIPEWAVDIQEENMEQKPDIHDILEDLTFVLLVNRMPIIDVKREYLEEIVRVLNIHYGYKD